MSRVWGVCPTSQTGEHDVMGPSQSADLARVLPAAPAVAANQYGHTYLGMGNEVPALHRALAPYEPAEQIDGYETS